MKVFIADSSPLLSKILETRLSLMNGIEVVGRAHDVASTLEAISKLRPHLVMLDVHLLGKNGLDLLKAVTSRADAPFVMMLSDDVSCTYQKHCADAGADFLLYKAGDLGKALAIVESILQRSVVALETNEGV